MASIEEMEPQVPSPSFSSSSSSVESSSTSSKQVDSGYKITAMYHFFTIEDPNALKVYLKEVCNQHRITGALILATEGINGTIAGLNNDIDIFLSTIFQNDLFRPYTDVFEIKYSYSSSNPFYRMRLKISSEIISMGVPNTDTMRRGTYVDSVEWNKLLLDPDVVVIDTRNSYEVNIGTFCNATNPNTVSFGDFPKYVDDNLDCAKHMKVAMFCTGGIRCEKSSSLLLSKGFEEVYTLKGGILKYLEDMTEEESLWKGECYVFDQRISVTHGLKQGTYAVCRSCRTPLSKDDLNSSNYEEGVQCGYCYLTISDNKKISSKERQLQITLANMKDKKHLGMVHKKCKHGKKINNNNSNNNARINSCNNDTYDITDNNDTYDITDNNDNTISDNDDDDNNASNSSYQQ